MWSHLLTRHNASHINKGGTRQKMANKNVFLNFKYNTIGITPQLYRYLLTPGTGCWRGMSRHVTRREERHAGWKAMEMKVFRVKKETKARQKMIGQCEGWYQREGTIGGGRVRPRYMEVRWRGRIYLITGIIINSMRNIPAIPCVLRVLLRNIIFRVHRSRPTLSTFDHFQFSVFHKSTHFDYLCTTFTISTWDVYKEYEHFKTNTKKTIKVEFKYKL